MEDIIGHAAIAIADAMKALDKKRLILIIGMLNTKNCREFLEPFKISQTL